MKYRKILRSAPFWLALVTIIFMGVKSSPNSQLFPGADKFYHTLGFAVLTLTAHLAFPRAALGSLFIWVMLGSAGIELAQTFSPARTASMADLFANLLGVLAGLTLIQLLGRDGRPGHRRGRKKRRRQRSARSDDDSGRP